VPDPPLQAAGEPARREIERKFLVERVPEHVRREPGEPIRQGYLALDGDTEVRLRLKGEERSLTVKHGRGRVRVEEAVGLDERQARALWALTDGRRLEKTRRRVGVAGLVADVDEYLGDLAGLRVVEVEFADEGAADRFEPPAWFGREVTAEDAFSARSLACDGRPEERG
jgi:adenylate cyclase